MLARKNKYDAATLEYWVETRTSGEITHTKSMESKDTTHSEGVVDKMEGSMSMEWDLQSNVVADSQTVSSEDACRTSLPEGPSKALLPRVEEEKKAQVLE